MTEAELATKSPENDAAEDAQKQTIATPTSSEEQAQAEKPSPALGEHCVTDRPTPSGEAPTGEITKLGDVDVYITRPADYPHSPSKLLLLLTGGTGIQSKNNQIQADKYAAEGFLVVMPDQFGGDAASGNTVTSPNAELSFLEKVKNNIADTAKSFMIDMWLARHTPETVLPLLHKVIEGAKDEFADAYANGGGLYAVGYCFGAKYVLQLGAETNPVPLPDPKDDEEEAAVPVPKGPHIKVGAIAHGTQITPEDIKQLKVPTILVCVENDPLFPDAVRQAGVETLEKQGVEHEVKVYPEVPHGFAVLGDYEDPKIKEAQKTAFTQMLGWLKSH